MEHGRTRTDTDMQRCLECGVEKNLDDFPYVTRGTASKGKPRQQVCRRCKDRLGRAALYQRTKQERRKRTAPPAPEVIVGEVAERVLDVLDIDVEAVSDERWTALCETLLVGKAV